jgi:hypothetical protein
MTKRSVVVRMASPELDEFRASLFRRYPDAEWATFVRFGWRRAGNVLVLTLAGLDPPSAGDLDDRVAHVAIAEPYTLRIALASEAHRFAIGIAHSHPAGCAPFPSVIDDDMDRYYADYFGGFTGGRPYVSLIASMFNDELGITGRVFWEDQWLEVGRVLVERTPLRSWGIGLTQAEDAPRDRVARLAAAFGDDAAARLRRAAVAVIGAGGTGSAAIEVLARAGVGRLIIVDPDRFEQSNLERVHGSIPQHAEKSIAKSALAREHVRAIDPTIVVDAFVGALPQSEVLDAVVTADVALGCTDQQHSRLALSDLATRYLVPTLDCGVMLEGRTGRVTAQVAQIVRFLAADPCAWCRGMIVPTRLAQELMSPEERTRRQTIAAEARARGERGDPYWAEEPQLNTVGYHTTMVGAMVAGYAIGWITGRFDPPFSRLQMNLVAPFLDVTDADGAARAECACRRVRGWADQGSADSFITAPDHWPPVQNI